MDDTGPGWPTVDDKNIPALIELVPADDNTCRGNCCACIVTTIAKLQYNSNNLFIESGDLIALIFLY